jgi:hypothetical protein
VVLRNSSQGSPIDFEMLHRTLEIPKCRAIDIDSRDDFRHAGLMLREALISFPIALIVDFYFRQDSNSFHHTSFSDS